MNETCPLKINYNYLRMPLVVKHMAYACLLVCFVWLFFVSLKKIILIVDVYL